MSGPISHGANALKLENEVIDDQKIDASSNKILNEKVMNTEETEIESIVNNNQTNNYEQSFADEVLNNIATTAVETDLSEVEHATSNGLENFGVEEETPDLFNSSNESLEPQDLPSRESSEDSSDDDDLEIPAFLRRQKN